MGEWTDRQLAALAREGEVDIETSTASGAARRTTIWVVVDGSDVFIRSVRGQDGRWYRDISARPEAALWMDGERIPVRATPAADAESVRRCSEALEPKYGGGPSTVAMLQTKTLGTTLRLRPLEPSGPTDTGGGA